MERIFRQERFKHPPTSGAIFRTILVRDADKVQRSLDMRRLNRTLSRQMSYGRKCRRSLVANCGSALIASDCQKPLYWLLLLINKSVLRLNKRHNFTARIKVSLCYSRSSALRQSSLMTSRCGGLWLNHSYSLTYAPPEGSFIAERKGVTSRFALAILNRQLEQTKMSIS